MSFTLEAPGYDLSKTIKCGQVFRYVEHGKGDFVLHSKDHLCRVRQHKDVLMVDTDDDNDYWIHYFNSSLEPSELERIMSASRVLKSAYEYSKGIRILQQDPFECLIEFIISQQKRIPQIKDCLERMCELCGEKLPDGSYAFPKPESITRSIAPQFRLGFREPYVVNAAMEVSQGFDLEGFRSGNASYDAARLHLMSLHGVGVKIADCVCLFSLGFNDAFPVDTHIQKVLYLFEMEGFRSSDCGEYAGLVQQYIYNWALYNGY